MKRSHSLHCPDRVTEILRHYLEYPETVDTLEGIARWRLLDDFVQRRVADTGEALQWLVAHAFLERIGGSPSAPPVYRLSLVKRAQAERFLSEHAEPTGDSTNGEDS